MALPLDHELRPITIRCHGDVVLAKSVAGELAQSLGFSTNDCTKIITSTCELAGNLIKHAGTGKLIIAIKERVPKEIRITTIDDGPGIKNSVKAMTDGYSTTDSLGYGLGAVNRLMDSLTIHSPVNDKGGAIVECSKLLVSRQFIYQTPVVDIWVSSRPVPGASCNGDTFVICHTDNEIITGVIDGLGHGLDAHKASEKARHYVKDHSHIEFPRLFEGVNCACLASRGVVMSLIRLDWHSGNIRLNYGSVGNIETRIFGSTNEIFPQRRGILGRKSIQPVYLDYTLEHDEILVMFSDGIQTHWDHNIFAMLQNISSSKDVQFLLKLLAKENDDATLLVVKPKKTCSTD